MDMSSLNIKNDRAVELVRQIAARYGTNCTQAIIQVAEAALSEPDKAAERKDLAQIDQILARYRSVMSRDDILTDDELYDEDGLPR